MLRSYLLLFAFLLASCGVGDRPEIERDLEARVGRIENGLLEHLQIKGKSRGRLNIDDRLEELGIPGLSVAFAANGEIQWARAYGMADESENRAMTTKTRLLAGSVSKPVAAVRALQLVEDGVFDLDKDINTYLTSWQVPDNEFTETELRQGRRDSKRRRRPRWQGQHRSRSRIPAAWCGVAVLWWRLHHHAARNR
jgi:CubicO group peptidase (beta-lactamase class C family)